MIFLSVNVLASPSINSFLLNPSSTIWVGENLLLEVNCTDDNFSIQNVTAQITGQDGYTIPTKTLDFQNGLFVTDIDALYLSRPNTFSVNFVCWNSNSEYTDQTTTFTVSNFTTSVTSITPSIIYLGDQIEIDISVKQNSNQISPAMLGYDVTKYPTFDITLNNQPVSPKIIPIPYDPAKGWVIYLNSPTSSGTYNLQISTHYVRVNDIESTTLNVNNPIQFSITSIDKNWVKQNDTINLQIQAFDKGVTIPLNANDLSITIDSAQATIVSITSISNYYNVAVLIPSLSSNSYTLTVSLSYNSYTYTSSKIIYYVLSVSGTIKDQDGNGIPTELDFSQNNVRQLKLVTDSNGAYSGYLPPGTCDVTAIFPQSTLYLDDVSVNSFSDPLKYIYFNSADVPGLNLGGLYVYEFALSYTRASIEMKYDERNIGNEDLIKVYQCSNWNSGKKSCNNNWQEVIPTIDKVRNIISLNTTSVSAYAIGTLKKLSVDFNLDKDKYYLKDVVQLKGVVTDEYRNSISNATVYVSNSNIPLNAKVVSDSSGIFSLEFLAPNKEGNYSLILTAERYPALTFKTTINIEVLESLDVSIVFPDTVRIKQGENFVQSFDLVNIGQTDLNNLNISLSGIPTEYYNFDSHVGKIGVGETKKISISFSIPQNATSGTLGSTLTVFNNEISKEKTFGFTITEKNQTAVAGPSISSAGFFSMIEFPKIDQNSIYIFVFAILCFISAFALKKLRLKSGKNNEVIKSLSDIKNHLMRKKDDENGKNN